jgi:O-antigen/teichoic acid export membrane protein
MKSKIPFLNQLLGLSKWALLAQGLLVLSYGVTTHWYTPQAFGIKAAITSVVLLLTNFSLGKLELAIPAVKDEATAIRLTLNALFFLVATTILTILGCLILCAIDYQNAFWLIIRPYWVLLPIFLVCLSIYYLLNYWMIRLEAFDVLGQRQGARAIYKLAIESVGILFGGQAIFLLGGLLVGSIGGIGAFLKRLLEYVPIARFRAQNQFWILDFGFRTETTHSSHVLSEIRNPKSEIKRSLYFFKDAKNTTKRFGFAGSDYSFYIVPTDFLHRLSSDLPIYALTAYTSVEYLGYYNVAMTLVSMVGSVVIEPFFQLYLSHFSKAYQTSQDAAWHYFLQSLKKIFFFGLIVSLGMSILGKITLLFFLGEKWRVSGELLNVLGFLFAVTFLHNFGFHTLNVIGQQRAQLIYAILRFFILGVGVFFFLENIFTLITTFVLGSLALSLGFVLYTTKILSIAKEKNRLS